MESEVGKGETRDRRHRNREIARLFALRRWFERMLSKGMSERAPSSLVTPLTGRLPRGSGGAVPHPLSRFAKREAGSGFGIMYREVEEPMTAIPRLLRAAFLHADLPRNGHLRRSRSDRDRAV